MGKDLTDRLDADAKKLAQTVDILTAGFQKVEEGVREDVGHMEQRLLKNIAHLDSVAVARLREIREVVETMENEKADIEELDEMAAKLGGQVGINS